MPLPTASEGSVHENGQRGLAGQFVGVGFLARYGSGHFTVTWADGSSLTLNLASTLLRAVASGQDEDGIVWLRVRARMRGLPDPRDELIVVLPFEAAHSDEVHRLAAELGEQTSKPCAATPAKAQVPQHGPDPVSGPDPVKGQQDARPAIRIGVKPDLWADDPHWLGLCPPTETQRLLTQRNQD